MSLLPHLETVISGNNLDAAQAEAAMLEILSGEATTAQIAALLGSADER
jgi:anthranilate phosphoribosyltransferase